MEWAKATYNSQYEKWVPWLEDLYLRWFTSHTARDTLGKAKVTGVQQVDPVQDNANNLVAGQVGQGGRLQPVGDLASKEGVNRAERRGKGEKGSYVPDGDTAGKAASGVAEGVKTIAGAATDGVKGIGGILGGR